jgi:hypothetical protein
VTIPKTDHDSLVRDPSPTNIILRNEYVLTIILAGHFPAIRYDRPKMQSTCVCGPGSNCWLTEFTANLKRNLYRGGIAEETLAVSLFI